MYNAGQQNPDSHSSMYAPGIRSRHQICSKTACVQSALGMAFTRLSIGMAPYGEDAGDLPSLDGHLHTLR